MSAFNNNTEDLSQLIDNFVAGKASEADKALLASKVAADPTILSEVNLQQDIVAAIASERKLMLKTRLQKIDTSTFGTNPVNGLIGYAASGIAAAVAVGAVIFIISGGSPNTSTAISDVKIDAPKQNVNINQGLANNSLDNSKTPIVNANVLQSESEIVVNTQPALPSPESNTVNQKPSSAKGVLKTLKSQPNVDINISAPDVIDQGKVNNTEKADFADVENTSIKTSSPNAPTKPDMVKVEGKFSSPHYTYHNSKIYLYGNFNAGIELVEYDSNSGKKFYLYDAGTYFALIDTKKQTPLVAVKDQKVIDELNKLRK